MKINYLEPFKHKHKHQKFADENYLPFIPSFQLIFMDHATKEFEVANFHGQATDTYAYV
jgi:hypothetical protein